MACGGSATSMSDTELRDRLRELGVSPGPITDSTRSLYEHKLWTLTQNRSKVLPKTLSSDGPDDSPGPVAAARSRSNHTQPLSPICDANTTAADHDQKADHTSSSSPSGPFTDEATSTSTALSPQMMAGNMGMKFLKGMLLCIVCATDSHHSTDLLYIYC